jgi:cytochrome c oxidase cbb3-type subunit III
MNAIQSSCVGALAAMVWGFGMAPLVASPKPAAKPQVIRDMSPVVARSSPADLAVGKKLFEANCSTCHGLDGAGGRGPDIQGVAMRLGDQPTGSIIRGGIPGTAMGAFWSLTLEEAGQVLGYVKTLGASATGTVTGDSAKGKEAYEKSGCAACHIVSGEGGGIGPELTRVGAMRGPGYLRTTLLTPGAELPHEAGAMERGRFTLYLFMHAVTKDGRAIDGMRVSENSFTIVLQDAAGRFHALRKLELRELKKEPGKSLMPSFKDRLSAAQLDNLVAYLASLKGAQ